MYGFVKQLANAFPSELRYGMLMKVVPSLAWLMSQLLILVALDNAIPNKNEGRSLCTPLAYCSLSSFHALLFWVICMQCSAYAAGSQL